MKRLITRPSPATVIACISLFVSLGGVGYAAATIGSAQIKNNAVKSTDLKNNDVRSKDIRTGNVASSDIKNDGATGTDILESSLGKVPSATSADNASNASNASNAGNANTLDGKDSSDFGPIAFARVDQSAALEAGLEKNMTNANVVRGQGLPTGVYCFGGISPAPKNIQAVHANDTFNLNVSAEVAGDTDTLCPPSHRQANVVTYHNSSGLQNADFHVLFN